MVAFVVVFTLLNLILWLFFYFKFKKTYSPKKVLENIASEVDKLLIEINNTTDRDLSLIESKIYTLREVIAQADKRVMLLEKEQEKIVLEKETMAKINVIKESKKQDNSSVNSYVKNAYKINNDKPKTGEISLFPAEDFGREPQVEIKEKSLKDRVLELYFQGLDVYLIAEKLDSSVAEVQTIINLFGK